MKKALSICWGTRPVAPIVFEGLELGLHHARTLGYQGVELSGNIGDLDRAATVNLIKQSGLGVSTVLTGAAFNTGATLSSGDPELYASAFEQLRGAIEFASTLDSMVSVGLAIGPRINDPKESQVARRRTVLALQGLCEYAASLNTKIALEPVNRYLKTQIQSVEETLSLIHETGCDNLGVTLDVFHANIEEASIEASIRAAGVRLFHVQISDSNRLVPGAGHMDFAPILSAMDEIEYAGWVSAEMLPGPDPVVAAKEWINWSKRVMPNSGTSTGSTFEKMLEQINSDPEFEKKATFFEGTVELQMFNESHVFAFNKGKVSILENTDGEFESDLVFSAPDSEWKKIVTGEIHLIKSMNPYHGNMSFSGDPVVLSGNMRPIFHLFGSLKGHVNV